MAKGTHRHRGNRTGNQEKNPVHSHLTFHKSTKAVCWRKDSIFQQLVLVCTDIHRQKQNERRKKMKKDLDLNLILYRNKLKMPLWLKMWSDKTFTRLYRKSSRVRVRVLTLDTKMMIKKKNEQSDLIEIENFSGVQRDERQAID